MCARGCTLEHYVTESIIASPECTTIKTRWLAKCVIKVLLLIKKLKTKFSELKKLASNS